MKVKELHAVVVCVNYADFLAHTLPNNFKYFNSYTVVTDTKDKETKRICEIYGVKCIQTDAFYENGAKFNKAKGINAGINSLDINPISWVLHLDADIWLHPLAMNTLRSLYLDPRKLHGCDRIMLESYKDYADFVTNPDIYKNDWLINLSRYKIGARITQYWQGEHYQVLGFFQLWNPHFSKIRNYPEESNGADKTDLQFSKKWDRSQRNLIADFIAVHLENEISQTGSNWYGRKTKRFQHI